MSTEPIMADDRTYAPSNPSYTNFFAAVTSGNVSNIDKSFTSSPNIAINALRHSGDGYEGMAALHIASSNGHVAMTTFLLSIGADIDVRDRNISGSSTPLHYAAFNCHTEVITTLLDNGAAVDSIGGFGGTALHQVLQNKVSVEQRHIATITLLLDRGLDIDFGDVELGNTVLHQAAGLKHIGLIELLLGRGADINAVNRSGSSVLGSAVDSGDYDTVKYLLDNGADANLPPGGFSAISRAAYHGNIDMVTLLLRDTSESTVYTHRTALHHAAAAGHVDIVQLLLNRNFAINARDSSGETPLLSVCAANRAHPRVVALLLSQGADISAQGRKGDTALHKAVWRSDAGVVGHLLAAGADLEACNDNGETSILTYARNISEHCLNNFHNTGEGANTRLEVFKLLLDAGADVGAKDGEGRSVLHALNSRPALGYMAVGKIEAARMLLERGAEVNVKDVEGRTALMVLNRGFEPDLARFLIDSGAEE